MAERMLGTTPYSKAATLLASHGWTQEEILAQIGLAGEPDIPSTEPTRLELAQAGIENQIYDPLLAAEYEQLGWVPPAAAISAGGVVQVSDGGTVMTNGYDLNGYSYDGIVQAGLPLAAVAGWTVGMLKALLARFGPMILKGIIGAAAFKEFMDLIFGGASDDTVLKSKPGAKGRGRRYSIGTNPRLNTLLKVAKRVDNIFVRYDRRISKFRSRIRGTSRRPRTRYYGPGYFLSPAERKQLKGG